MSDWSCVDTSKLYQLLSYEQELMKIRDLVQNMHAMGQVKHIGLLETAQAVSDLLKLVDMEIVTERVQVDDEPDEG